MRRKSFKSDSQAETGIIRANNAHTSHLLYCSSYCKFSMSCSPVEHLGLVSGGEIKGGIKGDSL